VALVVEQTPAETPGVERTKFQSSESLRRIRKGDFQSWTVLDGVRYICGSCFVSAATTKRYRDSTLRSQVQTTDAFQ